MWDQARCLEHSFLHSEVVSFMLIGSLIFFLKEPSQPIWKTHQFSRGWACLQDVGDRLPSWPQDGAQEGKSQLFPFGDSQVGRGREDRAGWALSHFSSIDSAEIPAQGSYISQISNCERHSIVFLLASRCWKLDTFRSMLSCFC